jgi:hypothetical protein
MLGRRDFLTFPAEVTRCPGVLANIARDLVKSLRRDVTTDWVSRDDVRAKPRSIIKLPQGYVRLAQHPRLLAVCEKLAASPPVRQLRVHPRHGREPYGN